MVKGNKKVRKKFRKDWMLGFLGLFGLWGIPEVLTQDIFGSLWLLWFLWFYYFVPVRG